MQGTADCLARRCGQPQAATRPVSVQLGHGYSQVDPYAWLRDDTRSSPEVLEHLQAENAYATNLLLHLQQACMELEDDMAASVPRYEVTPPTARLQCLTHMRAAPRSIQHDGPVMLYRPGSAAVPGPQEQGVPQSQQDSLVKQATTPEAGLASNINNSTSSSMDVQVLWWYWQQRGPGQDYWVTYRMHHGWSGAETVAGQSSRAAPANSMHAVLPCGLLQQLLHARPGVAMLQAETREHAGSSSSKSRSGCCSGSNSSRGAVNASDAYEEQQTSHPAPPASGTNEGHQTTASPSKLSPYALGSTQDPDRGISVYRAHQKVQVVLDPNMLAKRQGLSYCDVACVRISPDGQYVAYMLDAHGDEDYELWLQPLLPHTMAKLQLATQPHSEHLHYNQPQTQDAAEHANAADADAAFHQGSRTTKGQIETVHHQADCGTVPSSSSQDSLEHAAAMPDEAPAVRIASGCGPCVEWAIDSGSLYCTHQGRGGREPYQVLRVPLPGQSHLYRHNDRESQACAAGCTQEQAAHVVLHDEVESSCISLSTSSNGKYLLAAGRAATGQRIVRALPLSPAQEGANDAAWILLGPASDPDSMPNMVSSTPSSESDPDGGDRTSQEAGGGKSSSSSSTGYDSDDNVKNDIDRRHGSSSSSTDSLPDYDVLRADHWQQGTWLLLVDTDSSPDGEVWAWQGSSIAAAAGRGSACQHEQAQGHGAAGRSSRHRVLLPGQRGCQMLDLHVSAGEYLAISILERLEARVDVYRVMHHAPCSSGNADTHGFMPCLLPSNSSEVELCAAELLWTFAPGPSISSLHMQHDAWPAGVPLLRVTYSNMTIPVTTVDLDMTSRAACVAHVEEVPGYDRGAYVSETLWACSEDGTDVPVTAAYRKDTFKADGSNACILSGYGAYGRRLLPDFNPLEVALLNRGVVLAIAHVRGGGEMGAHWHLQGKKQRKHSTFDDIVAAARLLSDGKYSRPRSIAAWGRSAGGLAVAGALALEPTLWGAAILDVPFLEPLSAMCDVGLPLTVKERREWGDPLAHEDVLRYMASYSPYEQLLTLLPAAQEKRVLAAGSAILHEGPLKSACALSASGERAADAADTVDIQLSQADALGSHARLHGPTVFESRLEAGRQVPGGVIPAGMHVSHELLQARWPLLVTAGLHDMRVPYWGPAKYAALLRQLRSMVFRGSEAEKKREESSIAGEVLLMVNLGAGHFASSGAGQRLSERALKYAFLLSALGLLAR